MTKRKVRRKPRPTKPVDVDTRDQASRIVDVLTRWCGQSPGRSFGLERTPDGWAARLDDRRSSTGSTALDALAQVAVVASFDAADEAGS